MANSLKVITIAEIKVFERDKEKWKRDKEKWKWRGSLVLMVMRGDSCSEGCGFKSQHRKLDGHFSHVFFVKNCNVFLKR